MQHLEEEVIARWRAGGSSREEAERVRRHQAECGDCAARVRRAGERPSGERVTLPLAGATRDLLAPPLQPPDSRDSQPRVTEPLGPPPPPPREERTGETAPLARQDGLTPTLAGVPPPPLPTAAADAPLPRGTTVGRYLLLHHVGEGGMGVVYAAYDPELDRKVAIKLIRATGDESHQVMGRIRLLREAQAMARVSHPNVVPVHDVGTFGSLVFVAMDLVEGANLRRWLKEEQRPWRQVLQTVLAAGRGLAAAHAAGLAHRDFKPDNVLVGKDGRVQVTDFGLARLASGAMDEERAADEERERAGSPPPRLLSPLTQVGVIPGTPAYMAPEQHAGRPPDTRSDQFSFCATLYQALYGVRPFDPRRVAEAVREGRLLDSAPRLTASQALLAGGEAPLITAPPREPRLPGWLRGALMRGLSISPEQRFGSMEELLARLSGPPPAVRRARLGGALSAGVLVAALGGFGLVHRQSTVCGGAERRLAGIWDADVQRGMEAAYLATGKPYAARSWAAVKAILDGYAQRWVQLQTTACQDTRVRYEQPERVLELRTWCLDDRLRAMRALTGVLSRADAVTVENGAEVTNLLPSLEGCTRVAQLTRQRPPPEAPAARAEYKRLTGLTGEVRALLATGKLARGRELSGTTVTDARKLSYPPLLADTLLARGRALEGTPEGRASLREALLLAESSGDDEMRARAASALAATLGQDVRRADEALLWADEAQAILDRMEHDDSLQLKVLEDRSMVLNTAGRFAETVQVCERGLALAARALGPDAVQRLTFLNNQGVAYHALGDYARSRRALEEALALIDRVKGSQHPNAIASLNNLAMTLGEEGRQEEAVAQARRALELARSVYGPENVWVGEIRDTLASLLRKQGAHEEALEQERTALEIFEKARGAESVSAASACSAIGTSLVELNRPKEALPLLERALRIKSEDAELQAETRFQLARALMALPRDEERAWTLAHDAQDGYLAARKKDGAARVEAWIAGQWPESAKPAAALRRR